MSLRSTIARVAVLFALAAAAAPAVAQFRLDFNRLIDTAKNIGKATTEISEPQEVEIGRQYAAVLLGAAPLVADPALQRYVNTLGRWVALHAERPALAWHFGVLDSENVNAFATPGGYVLITRGLLGKMRSEAELANVLAHEISHVVKKHHLAAIRKGAGMQAGMNVLGDYLAQGGRSPEITSRLVSGMKEVMLRGLDKDDELEADRMGVVIAARAGYDPYGLPAVLQTLSAMNPQDSGLALLFATHPAPVVRLDALDAAMGTRLDRYAGGTGGSQEFQRVTRRK
jgi:beta-barrel assembly-enhancing protease